MTKDGPGRFLAVMLIAAGGLAPGQSTQGAIAGRVYDQKTGHAIPGANIECRNEETGESISTESNALGFYTLFRLAPGNYWIRATGGKTVDASAYQSREAYNLELFVAGRMQIDIPMRDLPDTYSQSLYAGSYLPGTDAIVRTYAADLATMVSQPLAVLLGVSGTLLSTLSYVVDPQQVRELPLSGDDIYTMLVALPGVTADNPTARGLGLSSNGQRSSSTNFLLDGVENNHYLLTGPLTMIAPEAVQEYRVSTNNYSAEYGTAAGLAANAVTRGGSNDWHGIVYAYLNDTSLDANSYQHIAGLNTSTGDRGAAALPRQPETDLHAGFWSGGRLIRNRLFWSNAFESFRSRGSGDPFPFQVPVLNRIVSCFGADHFSVSLLKQYSPPVPAGLTGGNNCDALTATYNAAIPIQFDRLLGLGRLDYVAKSHRLMERVSVSRSDQPDFIYSIYPGFSSKLEMNSTGVAFADLWSLNSRMNNELRLGFRTANQGWDRPNPSIPELSFSTPTDGGNYYRFGFSLPGSPAPYGFHYNVNSGDLHEVFTVARGRQTLSAGGGLLINRDRNSLTFQESGLYSFSSFRNFVLDAPDYLQITVGRQGPDGLPAFGVTPAYAHSYGLHQFDGFIQDNIRLTNAFGINVGLRYESFGAPRDSGGAAGFFQPGPGATIVDRLASGSMVYPSGAHSLYRPDYNNWAPRTGIFYDLLGRGHTILRASYGIFYDRPFDLLTLGVNNNSMELETLSPAPSYPQVSRTPVPTDVPTITGVPGLLWVDANLRTPYVQSWFGGIQHEFSTNLYFEVQAQGALGRKLISTDVVNRRSATTAQAAVGRLNQGIAEDILFRSNAASSDYTALTSLLRYRSRRGETQVAYTWGHSIDNQSDPLQGTFDDLQLIAASNTPTGDNRAGFTRQFQSGQDRASSDFDQRQNLVIQTIWHIGISRGGRIGKALLADWQVSGIAGMRSGFPYNLIAGAGLPMCPGVQDSATTILRNRPSLLPGRSPLLSQRQAVPGGYQILDISSFCDPGVESVGNVGRNALTGPGFSNVDLSITKSFRSHVLGEAGAIRVRADFFNAFNHANLGNPDGLVEVCSACGSGQALLGRQGVQPSFPSAMPLDQLSRQVQLQLKVVF